ncbi:MAG: response regulator [bacterium]
MAKILVVEDEEDIVEFIRTTLAPLKHEITHCNDGAKALSAMKKEKFDLFLLDIMIPGIDGYSILLELERDDTSRSVPCIVMSALQPAQKLFDRFERVKYFIVKPFSAKDLVQKVSDIIK